MLHAHHRTIAHLNADRPLKYLIRDYFALPKTVALMPALLARGLGQADIVLCLLRLRDVHRAVRHVIEEHIAALVGHPISICPSCLLLYRSGPATTRLDLTPRVTYVAPINPRQPNTEAHQRWPEYKVGRSVAQLKMRGITAKDLRLARRSGWIRLEEVA